MNDERGLAFGKRQTTTTAPDFANNRAYVIGVNAYSNGIPPLRTAVADAERLGQMLQESHGYQVRSFPNDGAATLATLRQLLREMMPQEVGPNDRVLFYFAGHGIALDGEDGPEGYLVPEDANRKDRTSFLAMTELHDALAKLPCRHLLLILDCCFAGAFRWSSTRDLSVLPSVIHRERFERYIQDAAWQVLTSAAHDQAALDVLSGNTIGERIESDKHSPFAAALFRALAGEADLIPRGRDGQPGGDGVITATELYLYLRECVETATVEHRTRQTPGLWPLKKHDKGEYILLSPGHELKLPPAPELNYANNPYRGLQSFDEEHSHLFFGRTRIIAKLHGLVLTKPLTVVLGASGTGKSSVVKAGLLPHLRRVGDEDWQILPPIRPGKSPLATLASLTLPGEAPHVDESSRLADLWSDENAFAKRIQAWAGARPSTSRLLVTVDQFEELITLCWDDWERDRFIELLALAIQAEPERFHLVVTLRSDFEPQFADCALKSQWMPSRYVVPPMSTDELREAIEGPASVRVLYFQPAELVDRLIDDVIQTPGAMPLLSFTLSELYVRYLERRSDDRCLTLADYEQLGGVAGSLRSRATELYDAVDGSYQVTMQRIMLRMVSMQGGELARRRVPKSELVYRSGIENDRTRTILRHLSDARLVVEGKEVDGDSYVEPAHDALVRGWDKLLEWTRKEQEQLTLRQLLSPAAVDWKQNAGGLWRYNPRLAFATRIAKSPQHWLNNTELEFVERSIVSRQRQLTALVGSVVATLIILAGLSIYALISRSLAVRSEHKARQETVRALTNLGLQAEEQGRTATALHHWAAAIAVASDDDSAQEANRLRIGTRTQQKFQLVAMLEHGTELTSASFDPVSSRLVTTAGRSARIWDIKTQELVRELLLDDSVRSAEFSPDGKLILTRDARVCIWNAESGELLKKLGNSSAYFAAYIARGKSVWTHSDAIRVWDAKTGRLIWEKVPSPMPQEIDSFGRLVSARDEGGQSLPFLLIESKRGLHMADAFLSFSVSEAGVSPDTRYLALPRDREITIYSLNDREPPRSLPVPGDEVEFSKVAFSPTGHCLVVIDGNLCRLFSTVNWREIHEFRGSTVGKLPGHQPLVDDVVFIPQTSWMLARSENSDSRIWETDSGMLVQTFEGHIGLATAESSADGQWLVTTSHRDNCARLYRREPGCEIFRFDVPSEGPYPVLSPDGKSILLLSAGTAKLRQLVGGGSAQLLDSSNMGERDNGGARPVFSPDGTRVAVASDDHHVSVWATDGMSMIGEYRFPSEPTFLAFSSDGKRLSVITDDGYAHVGNDGSTSTRQAQIIDEYVMCSVFDPSNRWLAVGDEYKVKLWDTSGDNPHVVFNHPHQVQDVAFLNNGRELAVALFNSEVHLWDIDKHQRVQILTGHTNTVRQVSEAPNGRDLFTLGLDGTVRIWDREMLKTRYVLQQPELGISSLAFTRDGRFIATGGRAGATAWDVSTGKRIVTFPCPTSVSDIVFCPDDQRLIALLDDRSIRIWTLNQLTIDSSLAVPWTESFTGTRLNDAGEVEALTADEWRSAQKLAAPWSSLEKKP